MSCCGEREKLEDERPEQRWDYINLSDFKSASCIAPLSYGVLYISLLISIAVYLVDVFTAANLLFFNRWSGQVQPVIPFDIARWIFAGCIMLSWLLLAYRWVRAIRVMRRGVVAASYLDPLAVRVQSVRMGKNGRGWRRFLLFAELTKGRKGAEYVALFAYFSFEAWLRIVFAEGPRQIINAVTLYTVMQANLIPVGQHAASHGHTPVAQFFVNVQILADANSQQAVILFGMLFTLIIWVFTAFGLILACLFYAIFLWHHIPRQDGTLSRYCRRKVDKRLAQIVGVKINKAIEKENKQRIKADAKSNSSLKSRPTLPLLDDDKSTLSRQTTQSSFSQHGPQSSLDSIGYFGEDDRRRPSALPGLNRPAPPLRLASQSSVDSADTYASDAPLMVRASEMGHGIPYRQYTPASTSGIGPDHSFSTGKPSLNRLVTQDSQRSRGTAWSGPISPLQYSESPYQYNANPSGTAFPGQSTPNATRSATPASIVSQPQGRKTLAKSALQGRDNYEMQPQATGSGVLNPIATNYTAYNPSLHSSDTHQWPRLHSFRSATAPPPHQYTNSYRSEPNHNAGRNPSSQSVSRHEAPLRSGTAPIRPPTSAGWASEKGVLARHSQI